MSRIYGKDFARFYNDNWAFWSTGLWPFLVKHVRKNNPGASTWLDLCCGTGNLLQMVLRNGFIAVGVDQSGHQIAHARRNAPRADLVKGDIRALSLERTFDVITCLFDSLNYLTSKRDLCTLFRRVRSHLETKGLFIFDMNTFEGMKRQWCRTQAVHDRRGSLVVESSFDAKRARGRAVITGFVKEGRLFKRFREEHEERGYRSGEIEETLVRAGLAFRKFDGDSLSRAGKRPARLIYICRST